MIWHHWFCRIAVFCLCLFVLSLAPISQRSSSPEKKTHSSFVRPRCCRRPPDNTSSPLPSTHDHDPNPPPPPNIVAGVLRHVNDLPPNAQQTPVPTSDMNVSERSAAEPANGPPQAGGEYKNASGTERSSILERAQVVLFHVWGVGRSVANAGIASNTIEGSANFDGQYRRLSYLVFFGLMVKYSILYILNILFSIRIVIFKYKTLIIWFYRYYCYFSSYFKVKL